MAIDYIIQGTRYAAQERGYREKHTRAYLRTKHVLTQ